MRRWWTLMAIGLAISTCGWAGEGHPIYDQGASGVWHRLLDLSTEHRVLHITAHPDDEHGGVLTWLSRGVGAHVALLSLTRGEAGANAIGPELFDGLGWIRAEELRLAGRYYGLDALYFTRLADYGYSKTLDEARGKWPESEALSDIVFVIRKERPDVIISRFRGDERDGHGQHQFAGVMSRLAFHAAGDPERFPEHFEEGVEPWQASKLYAGGYREDEAWSVAVDTSGYSPWLGDSFENVARKGLSLQRSQTSGIVREVSGPFVRYYARIESKLDLPEREASLFDGLPSGGAGDAKRWLERFDARVPERIVPELLRALDAASPRRRALLSDAITSALGVVVSADARPTGTDGPGQSPFAPPATMAPPVPGQSFEVAVIADVRNAGPLRLEVSEHRLEAPDGWEVTGRGEGVFTVRLPPGVDTWRPHVARRSIQETRYQGTGAWYRGAPEPPLVAVVSLTLDGRTLEVRRPVTRRESVLPDGHAQRELVVLPAVSLRVEPRVIVVGDTGRLIVELTRNDPAVGSLDGELELIVPEGVSVSPASRTVRLGQGAETFEFTVSVEPGFEASVDVHASFETDAHTYTESVAAIEHRDLETRFVVTKASAKVVAPRPRVAPRLSVGYVMGVGDAVPEAIEQLGAELRLLDADAVGRASLDELDAVVVGTRAYAVRADLREHNARLLDYVRRGGNLIVLYNTPELVPGVHAPFPGELPARSEEISEEDAPVTLLRTDAAVLRWPNPLGQADFDGWVEQRGSKFWSTWSDAYVPMLESHDSGHDPQRGGWLQARYGTGSYTYFAYALHRQLPYGVVGAYRILANLISLGRAETSPAAPR